MPQLKLIYLNVRGLGELPRLVMHYADVEFEDMRLDREQWMEMKSRTPFGQVPVLEVDGVQLAQSQAISRYLARRHGLAGKDDMEQAFADMHVDHIKDMMIAGRHSYTEKDPEKQKEYNAKYLTDVLGPTIKKLEETLAKNGSGCLIGSDITWADLAYYNFFTYSMDKMADLMKDAPLLKALIERIGNNPNIKKYKAPPAQ